MTIVGVAGDVRNGGPEDEPRPEFYYSYFQNPIPFMFMAVRTAAEPAGLIPAIRREIWSEDKDLPLGNISTLEQLLSKTIAQRVSIAFAGLFPAGVVRAVVGYTAGVSSRDQRTLKLA